MDNEPSGREDVDGPAGRGLLRERRWLVVCVALLAAACVLLWFEYPNAAFVAGSLGVSAWFFDERMRLKRRHDLVKLSGRNWVPRGEMDDVDDLDYVDDADDADDAGDAGGADETGGAGETGDADGDGD
jgi:hypothetical protein